MLANGDSSSVNFSTSGACPSSFSKNTTASIIDIAMNVCHFYQHLYFI
jgi:hypothetical protein